MPPSLFGDPEPGGTRAVNLHREPYDVYIGRPGKGMPGPFGNPVRIAHPCPECGERHMDGGSTLRCYNRYLRRRIATDADFRAAVRALHGKRLGCFCVPKPCHGSILAAVADELTDPVPAMPHIAISPQHAVIIHTDGQAVHKVEGPDADQDALLGSGVMRRNPTTMSANDLFDLATRKSFKVYPIYGSPASRLRERFDAARQAKVVEAVRRIRQDAPLFAGFGKHSLLTAAGTWGLTVQPATRFNGQPTMRYMKKHPVTHKPWPPLFSGFRDLAERQRVTDPDTLSVAVYRGGGDEAMRRNDAELMADPLVMLFLGATAVFELGGIRPHEPTETFEVPSGQVVVLDQLDRYRFYRIARLIPESSPDGLLADASTTLICTVTRYDFPF